MLLQQLELLLEVFLGQRAQDHSNVLLLRASEGGEMAIDIQMIEQMRLNDAEIEMRSLAVFGCRGG